MTTTLATLTTAPCVWCHSRGCSACGQTGTAPVVFSLLPTRTYARRAARYEPACKNGGRLTLVRQKGPKAKLAETRYLVNEFPCDFSGRAFAVAKVGSSERYDVFLGTDGSSSCSCAGTSYESASKANGRAWEAGETLYPTKGCVHTDCLAALLLGGFFDLHGGKA
jgi:hypothetical protein